MIFEDESPPAVTRPVSGRPAPEMMLAACAAEAGRLAVALGGIDHALSSVIDSLAAPPPALQGIDLLRQEAEGLAAALDLVAGAAASGRLVSAEDIARAVPLHDQRARLRVAGREDGQ